MVKVTVDTTLEELATLVSEALADAGISAILSGGGAVSLYSDNEYESVDLDFVTSARLEAIAEAIAPLGFHRVGKARHFEHPHTAWYLEFPPGPLGFGETTVSEQDAATISTSFGTLRIITATQCVMDRLAAYAHWRDLQAYDQALMVARRQDVDWQALRDWARDEGIDDAVLDKLEHQAG